MTRTKILATMGPAIDDVDILEQIFKLGVNAIRLNFSHGSAEQHKKSAERIRIAEARVGKIIGILADLQGPKIRIAQFEQGSIQLQRGDDFELSCTHPTGEGNQNVVAVDYSDLITDCHKGDSLLLDDGLIEMQVRSKSKTSLFCKVLMGGELKNRKGINLRGGGLSAPSLTAKDIKDMDTIAEIDADFVAVSFVRGPDCVSTARKFLQQRGCEALIVSKIERVEAVQPKNLDAIVAESDLVMIARGDLAVEVGDAELVGIQKNLIKKCLRMKRNVIVATQMMESMIHNPQPTRAEVMDVANAVIDGTDAVMLSAESAVGKYPIETVTAMHRVIEGAEKNPLSVENNVFEARVEHTNEVIALSAMYALNHLENVAAVVCMTSSGNTPRLLSRFNSHFPIYSFSRLSKSLRKMTLTRNVYPYDASSMQGNDRDSLSVVIELLKKADKIKVGDNVIFTFGDVVGKVGGTNCIQICKVE